MFYGGRLLSHLTIERDEKVPEELIELLKINQRAIVVIDSDKETGRNRINKTKSRIKTECDSSESYCWITHGREIENYIPEQVIGKTYKELFSDEIEFKFEKFEKIDIKLDESVNNNKMGYGKGKVMYAKEIIKYFEDSDISTELRKELLILVEKIESWNN